MQQPIPLQNNLMHVFISMADVKTEVSLESIRDVVLKFFDVDEDFFCSTSHNHKAVNARTYYAVLCKRMTRASLKKIGRMIGNRDHSTIISCLKRFRNYSDTDDDTRKIYENIKALVLGVDIPYPEKNHYIPQKPIAQIVREHNAKKDAFDGDDEIVVEHKTDNHYSYNREKSYQ